jgi:prepilin-type N-terminal cleavage/methylation domain-containing protein
MVTSLHQPKHIKNGFTIIELLVVIAILLILGGLSSPFYSNFLVSNYLETKTNEVITALRTAQINAVSGKGGTRWGVNISASAITVYKGNSYATRAAAFDQIYTIPATITITNVDVAFTMTTGNPTNTPTITISNNVGKSHTVTVNSVGTVDVN